MSNGSAIVCALALSAAFAACGAGEDKRAFEYMPDMARGPAYKAYAPNSAMPDGITLQRPVAGTIARGANHLPFHYGVGDEEAARAGRDLANPLPPTPRTLDEGRSLYQTYCLVCHGANGKGDGQLAATGKIPPPPSYTSERVAAFSQGRIFHVLSLGSGKMPSYAALLTPGERWKVVAYVKNTLQGGVTAAPGAPPAAPPAGGVQ